MCTANVLEDKAFNLNLDFHVSIQDVKIGDGRVMCRTTIDIYVSTRRSGERDRKLGVDLKKQNSFAVYTHSIDFEMCDMLP